LAKGLAEAGAQQDPSRWPTAATAAVAAALASGFHPLPVEVHGATGESRSGVVAFDLDTAIVEVANTCAGTLRDGRHAPMTASSQASAKPSARPQLLPSPAGTRTRRSASTDGGVGMLAALAPLPRPDG
jgi:hypothetical protein